MIFTSAIAQDEILQAAGIALVSPEGLVLFLKRGEGGDQPGTWCFPGGRIEGNETPEEAATRETSEETGFTPQGDLVEVDHQENGEVSFTTFHGDVPEQFVPKLNDEHVAYAWAPLSDPPEPLHPGVEVTISTGWLAEDVAIAFDRSPIPDRAQREGVRYAFDRMTSVRRVDPDGHLHVEITNISKSNICPYLGREIPKWRELGLEPDRIYQLYRDPEELIKGAATFNNKPLLSKHIGVSSEEPQKEFVIGSTGTDAIFEAPYLRNSLVIWDAPYIEAIDDETQKELSAAYRYRADMTPGTINGAGYDGVMRDIICNHVALVKEGRAGSDVVVGDSTEELNMSKKTAFSMKAVMARGAIAAFLQPKLAADAKLPLTTILTGVTSKNFKAKSPEIIAAIRKALPKLANDDAEGLKTLLSALEGAPVVDDMDPMMDVTVDKDVGDPEAEPVVEVVPPAADPSGEADLLADIKKILEGKVPPEVMAQIDEICANAGAPKPAKVPAAGDTPPPTPGAPAAPAKDAEPELMKKEDVDKAMDTAIKTATETAKRQAKETRDAELFVRPWVGELAMAHDSALGVFQTALGALSVEGVDKITDVAALRAIMNAQPKPGAKPSIPAPALGMDSKGQKSYADRFPNASRIKTL